MLIARGSAWLVAVVASGCVLAGCGGAQSRYESHMKRGQEYFDKGDYAKAYVEYRNALQILPKDQAGMMKAGATLMHLERYREAFADYQGVLDSDSTNREARRQPVVKSIRSVWREIFFQQQLEHVGDGLEETGGPYAIRPNAILNKRANPALCVHCVRHHEQDHPQQNCDLQ